MCVICPPFGPIFWAERELLARLTPFWRARRLTDEIIERDRELIREYKRHSPDSSGSPDVNRYIGLSVTLRKGFYYMWFRHFPPNIILTCFPLVISPDFIVQKSKLRRDQIEYLERRRQRDNS